MCICGDDYEVFAESSSQNLFISIKDVFRFNESLQVTSSCKHGQSVTESNSYGT